jgi:hypothetical protein
MPERTPGSGSRAAALQGCARACASQHIDSVTVLHLKDLVQGFWQNTALSWRTARFRTSGTAGEPPPGRSQPSSASAFRIARGSRPVHVLPACTCRCTCRRGLRIAPRQRARHPSEGCLCVVRTIRFSAPGIDTNAGSGGIVEDSRTDANTHAYRQCVRKSTNPTLKQSLAARAHHGTNYIPLSAR